VPVDEAVTILGDEEPAAIPLTPEQRKAAILAAFRTMETRGERVDFTASGVPNAKRLPALTGFEVSTAERDACWTVYRTELQEEQDQLSLDVQMSRTAEG
jgi:hypothetical protein